MKMSNSIPGVKKFVGLKIKEHRKKNGYSQQEFSEIMNLTRISIVNIESGRHSTTIEKLYAACRALNCTPNDLFPVIKKITLKKKLFKKKVIIKKHYKYQPII